MKRLLLTLLLLSVSPLLSANHFCGGEGEPPAGCSLEDALKHYEANTRDANFLSEFVGEVDTRKKDGKNYSTTGSIVRTEDCNKNNLILTNAHAFFDRKTGERLAKSSEFCLNGKCYEFDLNAISKMEKHGLLGARKFTRGERYLDYIVLPLKGKKRPVPKEAARLGAYVKERDLNKPMLFAGYHIKKKRVRFVEGCKIAHDTKGAPLNLFHNCPGIDGFSGGPLVNSRGEVVAIHASGAKEGNGQPYNPRGGNYNLGGGISQKLIDNLNRYCSDSN